MGVGIAQQKINWVSVDILGRLQELECVGVSLSNTTVSDSSEYLFCFFFRSIDVCISKYNNTNNKNRSRIIFETLSTPIMLVGEKVPAVSARCMFRINRQPSMGSGNNDTIAAANDLNTTFHPTLFFVYPNKWLFDSNIVSIPR